HTQRDAEVKSFLFGAPLAGRDSSQLGPNKIVNEVPKLKDELRARRQGGRGKGPGEQQVGGLARAAAQAGAADRVAGALLGVGDVEVREDTINQHPGLTSRKVAS